MRLLPWTGEGGQSCFLDGGETPGPVSRTADEMERVQLRMGAELRVYARELACEEAGMEARELRYLAGRLCEALGDALRIAESRGARLEGRAPRWKG
ncbi:hypothetical protein HCC30_05770 [Streptomyces sp. HNM0574]|nr:hypothetical protein [Streptomyces sp. HNM0574]NLU66776.1 hypothetical protein [Streptomyces sp. HNM0574]